MNTETSQIVLLISEIQQITDFIYPHADMDKDEIQIGSMSKFELQVFTKIKHMNAAHEKEHDEFMSLLGDFESLNSKQKHKFLQRKFSEKNFRESFEKLKESCSRNKQMRDMLHSIMFNSIHSRIGHWSKDCVGLRKKGVICFNPAEQGAKDFSEIISSSINQFVEKLFEQDPPDHGMKEHPFFGVPGEA